MAEVQTVYATDLAVGFAGMIANGETSNRISRTCEDSGGIGFGKAVYRGAGDHGCTLAAGLAAAGSEAAGNTGNGTITDTPTVGTGAKVGRYTVTIVEPATDAGEFTVEDPDGNTIGNGTVAVEFTGGGLTFTVADGSTDFAAGDQLYVDVSGGEFLGISIAHQALGLVSGQTVDEYAQYENVAILTGGVIFVEAGGTVTAGAAAQVDGDGNFVASGGDPLPAGWVFDTGGSDGDIVKLAKR